MKWRDRMGGGRVPALPRRLVAGVLFTLAYAAAAWVGLRWGTVAGAASPVFPAAGLGLAGLLLLGPRFWPAVTAGLLIAMELAGAGQPLAAKAAISLNNAAATGLAAWALRHPRCGFDPSLRRLRDAVALMGLGGAAAALAATVGAGVLQVSAGLTAAETAEAWTVWFLGDLTGALTVAPVILAWTQPMPRQNRWWVHFALVLAAALGLGWLTFVNWTTPLVRPWHVLPVLIWAAVALGARGGSVVVLAICGCAMWGLATGYNALLLVGGIGSPAQGLLLLQQFLAIAAATALLLAASVDERQGKAALASAEERLRLAQAAGGIGIWDWDAVRGKVSWSGTAYQAWGFHPAQMRPSAGGFLHIAHPNDQDRLRAAFVAMLRPGGPNFDQEFRAVNATGAVRWLAGRGQVVARDPVSGRALRVVGTNMDITARREAEAKRAENEARLRLAIQSAQLGVWELDLPGERWRLDRRTIEVTGAAVPADTWVPAASPAAQAWFASIHPDDRTGRLDAHARIRRGETDSYVAEYRVRRGEGWAWIAQQALVVERDPRTSAPLRLVGMARDVTVRRAAQSELERLVEERTAALRESEAQLAQAQKMQALGQLAGGIAHDFNNVLQAVAGGASLIERRAGDAAGVRRLARTVIDAAERGSSVTRRLLAFARRDELRAEAVPPAAVLENLRGFLAHTLGAGIAVRVMAAPDLPPLLADKGQLEAVLVNLATNARDAMSPGELPGSTPSGELLGSTSPGEPLGSTPPGEPRGSTPNGTLTFAADAATVTADAGAHPAGLRPGRYVRLMVADTGAGMDPATLARAVEPFFTTKPQGKGTGLGLSMARGFAEQSGGALHISSAPGKGTTVTLWLPEAGATAPSSTGHAPAPDDPGAPSRRVLVVDDDALVRETLASELEDAGYAVLAAGSGTEALMLLNAGEMVDALVSDLNMPGMDGLALIRAAQAVRPGLPAVLLTGYAGDDARLAVAGAVSGSFSLLRKPVGAAHLTARVAALLSA